MEQKDSLLLKKLLNKAYNFGYEMGTPSDDTALGKPYIKDFLEFFNKNSKSTGKVLEIGCGTGYLSKQLELKGYNVTLIEPGIGYKKYWKKYELDVINDFFPSNKIKGKFDYIIFYTVLEHIKLTDVFLKHVREHLNYDGKVFVSVPDCSSEIVQGDGSIFLHEHYHYFTPSSLSNTFISENFNVHIQKSNYGRSLYGVAEITQNGNASVLNEDKAIYIDFPKKFTNTKNQINLFLKSRLKLGSLGIFCPARILNYISIENDNIFFFDDSDILLNKYYPPFKNKIHSRKDLFNIKPKNLLIASRTFGKKIKQELKKEKFSSNIILLEDLIDE